MARALRLFAALVVVTYLAVVEPKRGTPRLVGEIVYVDGCRGVGDNAIVFTEPAATTVRGRGEYVLNGAFNVTRGAKRIAEIRLDLVRCRDSVSSNTCEHFASWRLVASPCKAYLSPGAPWTSMVQAIHPRNISCPMHPGSYRLVDATMDMKVLEAMPLPLEGSVWQSKMHHLEPSGALHGCFEGSFRFHRIRA